MGHVIGGLPQEKIAAHPFPTPVCFRIGQKVFEPISGSFRLIVDWMSPRLMEKDKKHTTSHHKIKATFKKSCPKERALFQA
jgi:hypothetical protein